MRASHHRPDGRFRTPWGTAGEDRGAGAMLRWMWERWRSGGWPAAPATPFPRATPRPARPRCAPGEVVITWVGHATALVQMGGLNVLTDPIWSRRASPVPWLGPARIEPPGIAFDDLPPVDAVLITHDHYDHLDRPTVDRLIHRFGSSVHWLAPLGHGAWLARRGADRITELDWDERAAISRPDGDGSGLQAFALPAQHWTRRTPNGTNRRLWCSWAIQDEGGRRIYVTGDSGYCGVFREIGRSYGPFTAALIPIGAYEPRWFMKPAHMNPEEAVQTYLDLGGRGAFVGVHWGTFLLTDEPPAEPPERTRAAWLDAGLPVSDLWLPAFGETRVIPPP